MKKSKKSLYQWCLDNSHLNIVNEWNDEENKKHSHYTPDRIEYDSAFPIHWICPNGHKWCCEVVGRTKFNLKCPECYAGGNILPIGTKNGCLTIIGGFEEYRERIEKDEYYKGWIRNYISKDCYKCKCECGKTLYVSQYKFLEKKHRFCTEGIKEERIQAQKISQSLSGKKIDEEELLKGYCGLAIKAYKKKQNVYEENARIRYVNTYDNNYSGQFFESLEVLECINENYKLRIWHGDKRKNNAFTYDVDKLYRCRCYLCNKELQIPGSFFHIEPPTEYGATAYDGYWSDAKCTCHPISSFQWIVNKLLYDNNIPYRVEVSFPDLYGNQGVRQLQFDFAVYGEDCTIKALIECQGEQHFRPVEEFGGRTQYKQQQKNDELKREYANKHNIPLIEISYKDKKYEKVKKILEENQII